MSWFFQPPRPVETARNGVMLLSRFFGAWTLRHADGSFQAAPYMDGVWKKAVRHVRRQRRGVATRRVLILGVAMGSTFMIARRAWPDAEIVGMDWEPSLYALGQRIGVVRPDERMQFTEGDALITVPQLEGEFDVALVDLFNGRQVTDAASDGALQDAVTARLALGGTVAVNCYNQRPVLVGWASRLGAPVIVRYASNDVGVFLRT